MNPEIIGNRIKQIMKNRNITIKQLSIQMGMDEKSLKCKLDGNEEFYLEEMSKVKEIFNLSLKEFDELFFKEIVDTYNECVLK